MIIGMLVVISLSTSCQCNEVCEGNHYGQCYLIPKIFPYVLKFKSRLIGCEPCDLLKSSVALEFNNLAA